MFALVPCDANTESGPPEVDFDSCKSLASEHGANTTVDCDSES